MPVGLRFIPDVLRLQFGVPGGTVRVVKVSRGGTVEDLDHRADFEITTAEGKEVIAVKWTASGPVFIAKKLGEADVHARLGDLTTQRPLRVMVVDPAQQQSNQGPARLQVQPDPLNINIGQKAGFGRVQLIPPEGAPVDVDYSIVSNNNNVVSADGNQLSGVSLGQARVTLRPVGVPPEFADVKTDVTVNVQSPPPPTPKDSRLVLKGPSRGTIGAPLDFRVELDGGGTTRDVTHDGAALVLNADQIPMATIEPGCILVPKQPGVIRIKARFKDAVSNALAVAIDPAATEFEKLELDVVTRPMTIGERRSYKLWGYPVGRGPRQDLTHRVNEEANSGPAVVVAATPSNDVFSHTTPTLVGNSPGTIRMVAKYNSLRSEIVEFEVADTEPGNVRLKAQPSITTIRVGERTAPITVLVSTPAREHPVDVVWTSEDQTVAAPDPKEPGRFIGKRVGQTQLKATFGNQSTTVAVRVTGDPFTKVTIKEQPDFQPGNRFSVNIEIEATNSPDDKLEYRVSTGGDPDSGDWKPAPGAANQRFEMSSPPLKRGPDDTTYHLKLEARDPQQQVVARYPLSFSLRPAIQSNSDVEVRP